jgi:D-glycero-beta-D-manno-heptose 1-phosphate adenylyltransferase
MTFEHIEKKIQNWDTLANSVKGWQSKGEKVVFTNGCFDLLHYGHIHYLAEARDLGDRLIVAMNSAASIKRLKGEHRPINDEMTRLFLMASLEFVDTVVIFEEDTPLNLIQLVMPDILVKGGDWQPHQIIGSDMVLANGGKVRSLPFIDGYSTTNLEKKIRSW